MSEQSTENPVGAQRRVVRAGVDGEREPASQDTISHSGGTNKLEAAVKEISRKKRNHCSDCTAVSALVAQPKVSGDLPYRILVKARQRQPVRCRTTGRGHRAVLLPVPKWGRAICLGPGGGYR